MKKEIIINNNFKTNIVIKNKYINKYLSSLAKKNDKIFCIVDQKLKKISKLIIIEKIFFLYI